MTLLGRGAVDRRGLTHLDERGRARMVDVASKPLTKRVAIAKCDVVTTLQVSEVLGACGEANQPIEVARLAGLLGGKQTSSLIPLCHPIRLDGSSVEIHVDSQRIGVVATCHIVERTGVEMEALTTCAFAALTLVHWLMPFDPHVSIEGLAVCHKSGGKSGEWPSRSSEVF